MDALCLTSPHKAQLQPHRHHRPVHTHSITPQYVLFQTEIHLEAYIDARALPLLLEPHGPRKYPSTYFTRPWVQPTTQRTGFEGSSHLKTMPFLAIPCHSAALDHHAISPNSCFFDLSQMQPPSIHRNPRRSGKGRLLARPFLGRATPIKSRHHRNTLLYSYLVPHLSRVALSFVRSFFETRGWAYLLALSG